MGCLHCLNAYAMDTASSLQHNGGLTPGTVSRCLLLRQGYLLGMQHSTVDDSTTGSSFFVTILVDRLPVPYLKGFFLIMCRSIKYGV